MTRSNALAAVLLAALVAAAGAVAAPAKPKPKKPKPHPSRIALPDGFQPEGIAAGRGQHLFVGSIPTGAVLRINARTGETTTVVEGREGAAAIGLKADRQDRLYVAGGATGKVFIYDARTGEELAALQVADPAAAGTFINDVTLTRTTAYFTDSQRQMLYAVARDGSGFREIPIPGVEYVQGFNLNGIVATPGGRYLLAINSTTGVLWRIDPESGAATPVDLGDTLLTRGDGLLLQGKRLYVVRNTFNQVAVVKLRPGFTRGEVTRTLTSSEFDVPTTVARKGGSLFLPNARFGNPDPAAAEYWVTRIRAKG